MKTDTPVLTPNSSNSRTKDNSINSTLAVNNNDSVDTINTATSDNLFNDEQNTPDVLVPPKQQRVGKQQRKSDFADFKETYLMPSKQTKRHSVNIEESVWEQLERVARILGDRENQQYNTNRQAYLTPPPKEKSVSLAVRFHLLFAL